MECACNSFLAIEAFLADYFIKIALSLIDLIGVSGVSF
jgi:hypothetical protein